MYRILAALGTAITPLQRGGFPPKKNEGICTEIIFMKYKEEVQVTTTVNECLDFIQTLPLNIMQITMKQKPHEKIYYSNLRTSCPL